MKKIYFLALALTGFVFSNAQLTDDFESYPEGPYFGGNWTNWSNDPTATELHLIVATDQAAGGTKAGYIGSDLVQDPVLNVGLKTSGVWTYSHDMYIDFGSSGYFNAQHDLASLGTEGNWAYQAYVGIDPTQTGTPPSPGLFYLATAGIAYSFPYVEEEWFNIALEHDLDNDIVRIYLNGELLAFGEGSDLPLGDDPVFQGKLNGFNYYSAAGTNSMYFDNVKFYEGPLAVNDANVVSTISVYPTVANEVINVTAKSNISEVSVFNTNGQQVAKVAGNGTSAQVNVSALPAGVYIVKTVAGKETKTTKVVVK